MRIKVAKFGEILTSRPSGREAGLAIKAYQKPKPGENIEIDFEGVLSVGPSWLDEVLRILYEEYGRSRVTCLPSTNKSVIESLKILQSSNLESDNHDKRTRK